MVPPGSGDGSTGVTQHTAPQSKDIAHHPDWQLDAQGTYYKRYMTLTPDGRVLLSLWLDEPSTIYWYMNNEQGAKDLCTLQAHVFLSMNKQEVATWLSQQT